MKLNHKILVGILVILLLAITSYSAFAATGEFKISEVKVDGKVYTSGSTTSAFSPGDNIDFIVSVENSLTDVIVEPISVAATADSGLKSFPTSNIAKDQNGNLIKSIASGKRHSFTVSYTLPFDLKEGTYGVTFKASGVNDNAVDAKTHEKLVLNATVHTVKLNVVQATNGFKIVNKVDFKDQALTCGAKKIEQVKKVTVAYTGDAAKNEVYAYLVDSNNKDITAPVKLSFTSSKKEVSAEIKYSAKNLIGANTLFVKLISAAGVTYDSVNFKVTADNCAVSTQTVTLKLVEDKAKEFPLKDFYTNTEDSESVSITVVSSTNIAASVDTTKKILKLTPKANFVGNEDIKLTFTDGVGAQDKVYSVTVTNDGADAAVISKISPTTLSVDLPKDTEKEFSATVKNPDGKKLTYRWLVDGNVLVVKKDVTSKDFTATHKFKASSGTHTVKFDLVGVASKTWNVKIIDRPTDIASFPGSKTTGIESLSASAVKSVKDFTLDTAAGTVVFDGTTDLSGVSKLASIVTIKEGYVSVDSNSVLAKKATVTIKKTFTNPEIKKYSKFNAVPSDSSSICTSCTVTDNGKTSGLFTFTVDGFSTYEVVEKAASEFSSASEVFFDNVDRNKEVSALDFSIKNLGSTDAISDIKFEVVYNSGYTDAKYKVDVSKTFTTLSAGEEKTVSIKLFVPDESAGEKFTVATLKVTGKNSKDGKPLLAKDVQINLKPKSFLNIESVEINGDTNGDFKLDGDNKVEVEIKNTYSQDMKKVEVTVEVLNVDGDNLEENKMIGDLNDGGHETVKLTFNFKNEDIDRESYTLRVTVEGKTTDGVKQKSTTTQKVQIQRENHKVVIAQADLSHSTLQCLNDTTLTVGIKNIGEKDEDNVEVRITSTKLGIDLKKSNLGIEDYTNGDDSKRDVTFYLSVGDVDAGTYPITVRVYRDEDLEETQTVDLTINGCGTATGKVNTLINQKDLVKQMQAELNAKNAGSSSVSFRESNSYVYLLGTLLLLGFVAIVLAMAVLVLKRKR